MKNPGPGLVEGTIKVLTAPAGETRRRPRGAGRMERARGGVGVSGRSLGPRAPQEGRARRRRYPPEWPSRGTRIR